MEDDVWLGLVKVSDVVRLKTVATNSLAGVAF